MSFFKHLCHLSTTERRQWCHVKFNQVIVKVDVQKQATNFLSPNNESSRIKIKHYMNLTNSEDRKIKLHQCPIPSNMALSNPQLEKVNPVKPRFTWVTNV